MGAQSLERPGWLFAGTAGCTQLFREICLRLAETDWGPPPKATAELHRCPLRGAPVPCQQVQKRDVAGGHPAGLVGVLGCQLRIMNYSIQPHGGRWLISCLQPCTPPPQDPCLLLSPFPICLEPTEPSTLLSGAGRKSHCSKDEARDICEGTHFCPGEGPHRASPPGLLFKQGLEVLGFTNGPYKGHGPAPEPRVSR